jgi:hypothetical protein
VNEGDLTVRKRPGLVLQSRQRLSGVRGRRPRLRRRSSNGVPSSQPRTSTLRSPYISAVRQTQDQAVAVHEAPSQPLTGFEPRHSRPSVMIGAVVAVGRNIIVRTETGDGAVGAAGRMSKHGYGH